MLFKKNKKLKEIIDVTIDEEYYNDMEKWKGIYAGYYKDIHDVTYHTIAGGQKKRRRHTLNMAKVISSELSKLIFNEKVEINIGDEEFSKNIHDVLSNNRFYKMFQRNLEKMLAIGGVILKVHPEEQKDGSHKLKINYVLGDSFIPIAWDNGIINEGAFINTVKREGKTYHLFEVHKWKYNSDNERILEIKNNLYVEDKNSQDELKSVPLEAIYPDLDKVVTIEGLSRPLFQYISPAGANNINLNSPMGLSIFANSIDTLYAIDVAFDSFIREFRLGQRRIIVPDSAIKTVVDTKTGGLTRYFDADDEVYQAFRYGNPDQQKIADNTVPIRAEEHISAINSLLDVLAMQTGFSGGTFNFDGKTVKTATEIVSENSKTYQTVVENEEVIEESLDNFIHTLGEVASLYDIFDYPEDVEIGFGWDDSIIKDKYSDADFWIKLKHNNIVSEKYAIEKILEFTPEQAIKMQNEIYGEQPDEKNNDDMITGDEDIFGPEE